MYLQCSKYDFFKYGADLDIYIYIYIYIYTYLLIIVFIYAYHFVNASAPVFDITVSADTLVVSGSFWDLKCAAVT